METANRVKADLPDYPDDWVKPFECNHVVVSFTPDKLSEDGQKTKKSKSRSKSICVMCGEKVKDKRRKSKDKTASEKTIGNDIPAETVTSGLPQQQSRRQYFQASRRTGSQVSLQPNVDSCSMHSHKKIKYYCEDHQELCCSVCVNVLHPKCDRVMLITDEIKTGFDINVTPCTIEALKNIRGSFEQIIDYNNKIMESLEKQCEEARQKRDELRDKMLKLVENFEKSTNKSIKKYMKMAKQEINSTTETCREAIHDLEASLELLEHTATLKVPKDLFIATQKANNQKESYAIALSDAINHTKELHIELVPETNLNSIEDIQQIGKIEFIKENVSFPEPLISSVSKIPSLDARTPRTVRNVFTRSESTSSLSPRQPVLQGTYNTRLTEDKNVCENVAATFLLDGRIAFADVKNCKLKVFDTKFRHGSTVSLSSGPRGVTAVSPQEVAVSLPDESKIQFASTAKKLKLTRSILTNIPCYGITCYDQDLVVLCDDGFSTTAVQVIDLNGQVKQSLEMSKTGKVVLKNPWNLVLNRDGKQICITDRGRLVCMDMAGSVKFKYAGEDLDNARGLAIDNRGRFYVCGTGSNNLHQVSPDGQKIRILLSEPDVTSPQSVCIDSEKGLLLLTSVGCDTVSLYKMTTV